MYKGILGFCKFLLFFSFYHFKKRVLLFFKMSSLKLYPFHFLCKLDVQNGKLLARPKHQATNVSYLDPSTSYEYKLHHWRGIQWVIWFLVWFRRERKEENLNNESSYWWCFLKSIWFECLQACSSLSRKTSRFCEKNWKKEKRKKN